MVFDPGMPGPVVLGGGIIAHLTGLPAAIGEIIRAAGQRPDIRLVDDGSVGAVVLALRSAECERRRGDGAADHRVGCGARARASV